MPSTQYVYLIGDLMAFPLWALLFFARSDCRKEMLWTSVCIGLLTVLFAPPFLKDYWRPEYLHTVKG